MTNCPRMYTGRRSAAGAACRRGRRRASRTSRWCGRTRGPRTAPTTAGRRPATSSRPSSAARTPPAPGARHYNSAIIYSEYVQVVRFFVLTPIPSPGSGSKRSPSPSPARGRPPPGRPPPPTAAGEEVGPDSEQDAELAFSTTTPPPYNHRTTPIEPTNDPSPLSDPAGASPASSSTPRTPRG